MGKVRFEAHHCVLVGMFFILVVLCILTYKELLKRIAYAELVG